MTHKKNNYKVGLFIGIGIGILIVAGIIGIYYSNSSANYNSYKNNKNLYTTTTSDSPSTFCPMIKNGLSCGGGAGGCGMSRTTNSTTTENTTSPIPSDTIDQKITYETINAGHDEYSLLPETLSLNAGKNYKLIITPSADGQGCMNNMTIPGLDNNIYDIKKGIPITITINNTKPGKYEVVCGNMGMHQGQIIVQ